MQESRDPAIKLFGQKIPLQGEDDDPTISGDDSASPVAIDVDREGGVEEEEGEGGQRRPEEEQDEAYEECPAGKVREKEAKQPSDPNVSPKTPSIDEGTAKSSKHEDGTSISQEKPLKKPEKVLACPRCNSMDTKFCYYNNYNINQPRYFCKSCQRYWTDGGNMRNVPVGAGRRKSKNTSSHYRHITISEALEAARMDAPDGTNGKVLSFGLDSPTCDSMASVLNLAEKIAVSRSTPNGFHSFENQKNSSSMEESGKNQTLQIPCHPCVPWSYPPAFAPLSFYHHPAALWNVPWFSLNSCFPTTMESPRSGSNSPKLGKHSREGDMEKQRKGSVLVPKTLRIDDPSEAAKSSIWTTLGIKNESVSKGGMFEAFETSGKHRRHRGVETSSSVLRANPAALSRSLNFRENA